jgi:hypothetical protein
MSATDKFIIYDNVEFSKGWINRNRILVNGQDSFITVPLKRGSDYLMIKDRDLADSWNSDRKKILNRIRESYRRAPFFDHNYSFVEDVFNFPSTNLFEFLHNSIVKTNEHLNIGTTIEVSSDVPIDHDLRSEQKVIALCKACGASHYINPIGGVSLYLKENFQKHNIELSFLKPEGVTYKQFNNEFIPWLSIIDVMMFNSTEDIKTFLDTSFQLV